MWICPHCNTAVPNPVNRKCPNGHGLSDPMVLGFTTEQSAGKSFVKAFLICIAAAVLVILSRLFVPEKTLGHVLGLVLVFFIAFGVVALLRALKWKRQGGPVLGLVPRAFGTGLGCVLAGGGLLAIGFALAMIG